MNRLITHTHLEVLHKIMLATFNDPYLSITYDDLKREYYAACRNRGLGAVNLSTLNDLLADRRIAPLVKAVGIEVRSEQNEQHLAAIRFVLTERLSIIGAPKMSAQKAYWLYTWRCNNLGLIPAPRRRFKALCSHPDLTTLIESTIAPEAPPGPSNTASWTACTLRPNPVNHMATIVEPCRTSRP